jgi:hypothetical protein
VPSLADRRVDRPADRVLADALTGDGDGIVVVGQVVSGLGGVGKTQLAAGLAHRWWRERRIDLLVWVTATTRTAVLTRYAQAAADLTGVQDPDPADGAERFLAWLAAAEVRWLIVLDDVTDPADLTGLWPAVTSTGSTVVTSRRRDHALTAGRQVIDVDVFTPAQALDYLHDKLGNHPARLAEAAELAADLDHLPLALAQAAAYIADQIGTTCADYRRHLHHRGLTGLIPTTLPDEHRNPVAATWAVSIDLADRYTTGLARPLLELAALLDPNTMPVQVFTNPTVIRYTSDRTARPVQSSTVLDTLRVLHRLSLATLDETATSMRVHAVAQRAIREATDPHHQTTLAIIAADALLALWPEVERDATHAQALRANTTALHDTTGKSLWTIPTATTIWQRILKRLARRPRSEAHTLLFRAGFSLGDAGLVTAAHTYFQHLHTTALQHLGPDHPDTLTTRHNLARWQGEAGDPAGAATAYEQLLTDRLRVLGPDHPDTLDTRYFLASFRGVAGDPPAAVAAIELLLADRVRVLGPNHPNTVDTRHELARWHGEAGNFTKAVEGYEAVLADWLRVVGPDSRHTLAARAELARWRGVAGDAAGAVTAFEQLLVHMLRVLGPEHPRTLIARHNLAYWRGQAGDPAGAVAAFEQVLTDRLRVLGPNHPATLATRHGLAHWRGQALATQPTSEGPAK